MSPYGWSSYGGSLALGLLVLFRAYHSCLPLDPRPDAEPTSRQAFVDWERDRVLSCAKGMGTAAVGFLLSAVAAALKVDAKVHAPVAGLLGCLAGALGLVIGAAVLSGVAARYAAGHVQESSW